MTARLIAVTLFALLPLAGQQKQFPMSCPVCNQTKRMAWGSFREVAGNLEHYVLPQVKPEYKSQLTNEPWIFEITLNLDGKMCSIRKEAGRDGVVADALLAAIKKWQFRPFFLKVLTVCYQFRVFLYLRDHDGQMVFVAPGVTSSL